MSGFTLALDGSTYAASVAVLRDGEVIAERQISVESVEKRGDRGGGGGESLVPAIAECLSEAGLKARQLGTVICGDGPGSFTSLRIAASIAKGIAFAAGAELFAVSSLMLTIAGHRDALAPGEYLSVLPAMRGESFAQSFSVTPAGSIVAGGVPRIVKDAALEGEARSAKATLIGPGCAIDALPHARGVARLLDEITAGGNVDLDSWEPNYGRLAEAQVRWEAAHGRPLGG